jgi:hypothetical protein
MVESRKDVMNIFQLKYKKKSGLNKHDSGKCKKVFNGVPFQGSVLWCTLGQK